MTAVSGEDAILVAVLERAALIRVIGRGTFKTGASLKQFCGTSMSRGVRRFFLDMEKCAGMDSTFMGVIAGVALRLQREQIKGRVALINSTEKVRTLLETLGLDRLVDVYQAGDDSAVSRELLEGVPGLAELGEFMKDDRRLTVETMLEAHQDLVRADPANRAKFCNVIEYLGRDLESMK